MKHRSKEGLTKARIIDAVLNGHDTRKKLRAYLEDISRKDLNYHLQINTHGGLGLKQILIEQNGKIVAGKKNLKTISKTIDYLVKLPKYKDAFDMAFAECFYSGFGESFLSFAITDYSNVGGDTSKGWLGSILYTLSGLGGRVPSVFPYDTRGLFIEKALRSFREGRGELDTEIQISYIATVLQKSRMTFDLKKTTLANASTHHMTISEIIRHAKINGKFTAEAFDKIACIANKEQKTFLDPVNKYEKVFLMVSYVIASLYNWKISDAVSKLAIPIYNMLLDANPYLEKSFPNYFRRMK